MAEIVNVRVKHIRPRYHNLKEWCEDGDNVYIGRRGAVFIDGKRYPPHDSIWANPFKVGIHGDLKEVLSRYEKYISGMIRDGEADLNHLRGKRLGCWCKPNPCHGDILVKMIASSSDEIEDESDED